MYVKTKKLLGILLALVMIVCLSTVAFAAEEETDVAKIGDEGYPTLAEAIANVGAGDVVIELLADATMDYGAREAYGTAETTSLTINGNGYVLTLNQTNSDWSSVGLANANAKLVLNNMTINKPTAPGNGAWNNHAIIFSCNVEMTDVTVNNSVAVQNGAVLKNVIINEAGSYYGLWISGNGQSVIMNGGEINATNGGRGIKIADQYVNEDVKQVTLSVSGTKFNTAKKAAVLVTSTAGAAITANDVDISNVAEDSTNIAWVDAERNESFGNVTVNSQPAVMEDAEDFVAVVSGAAYKTLADAIAAAQDGDTVTLLADVTADSTVTINKSITLDGNNHKISGTASPLLKLGSTANITVKNATLKTTKNVVRYNYVNAGYTHTYQNCQISGGVYGIHYDGNGGEVVIDGCTIDGFNAFAGALEKVTVKDTTFDADQSGYAGANFWGNAVIENVTLVDEGKTTWLDVITDAKVIGGKVVKDGTEIPLESYLDASAKIGVVYYDTLQAAVDAATEGDTIVLLADVEGYVMVDNKSIKLDLNGKKIEENREAYWAVYVRGDVTFTVEDSSADATGVIKGAKGGINLQNGVKFIMNGGKIETTGIGMQVYASEATINDGAIDSEGSAVALYSAGDMRSNFTMNGGSLKSADTAIIVNGSTGLDKVDATINNGSVTSTGENCAAIYWPSTGKLTINGGEITGDAAVYVKSGSLEITGGTLNGNAEKEAYTYTASGYNTTGDAVIVENVGVSDYEAVASVSISGGEFISENASAVASYTAGNEGVKAVTGFITGGTFNTDVSAYLAEGYVQNSNGSVVKEYVGPALYTITKAACENGKVTVQAIMASKGSNIKVSAVANEGYKLVELVVTDASGKEIEVVDGAFKMPASSVTVSATFVYDLPFIDVADDADNYAAIAYMYETGLMIGTSTEEYIFDGESTMTRAQIAMILYRLAGEPEAAYAGTFTDAPEGAWYTEAVEWAASKNIIKGMGNGTFAPDTAITVEQLAALVYRYAQCQLYGQCVSADWATESVAAMTWCMENGVLAEDAVASAAAARYLAAEMFYAVDGLLNK